MTTILTPCALCVNYCHGWWEGKKIHLGHKRRIKEKGLRRQAAHMRPPCTLLVRLFMARLSQATLRPVQRH